MATADADGHARLVVVPGTLLLSTFVRDTEVRATRLVEVGHGAANAVTLRLP